MYRRVILMRVNVTVSTSLWCVDSKVKTDCIIYEGRFYSRHDDGCFRGNVSDRLS